MKLPSNIPIIQSFKLNSSIRELSIECNDESHFNSINKNGMFSALYNLNRMTLKMRKNCNFDNLELENSKWLHSVIQFVYHGYWEERHEMRKVLKNYPFLKVIIVDNKKRIHSNMPCFLKNITREFDRVMTSLRSYLVNE